MDKDNDFSKICLDEVIKKAKIVFSKRKSPFFLIIKKRISENVSLIKKETSKILKEFKIAYPVKTNPNLILLSELFALGSDFMISGIDEFSVLIKAFDKTDIKRDVNIFYYSPILDSNKLDKICSYVKKYNTSHNPKTNISIIFVIDSQEQLNLINSKNNLKYIIRLNVFSKLKDKSLVELEKSKDLNYGESIFFGINSTEIKSIFNSMKIKKNNFLGFHCHMSSQIINKKEWDLEVSHLIDIFRYVDKKGYKCSIINLGGGISVDYSEPSFINEQSFSIKNHESKKKRLSLSLSALKYKLKDILKINPETNFYFEPGRFISADSFLLVTRIIAKKMINKKHFIVINSSLYNSSMDSLVVGLRLPVMYPEKCSDKKRKKTEWIIKGSTPCSLDWFNKIVLCSEPKIGSMLIFDKAGAYNYSSDFASLKKLKVYKL